MTPLRVVDDDQSIQVRAELLVLVVDDEPSIVALMASGLPRMGIVALTASSAAEARTLLAARQDIGVVVSDINMPSETGLSLAQELLGDRPEDKALEVILMTGMATAEDAIAAVRTHVFDFVPKPFGIRQMGEIVRRALKAVRLRRERAADAQAVAARIDEAGAERLRLLASVADSETRLERASVELVASQRTRSDLIAVVSHELRTPLIPIIGFAEIMQGSATIPTDDLRRWAAAIEANGLRLLSMIDGALEIVAFDQGIRQTDCSEVDLVALLDRVVASRRALAAEAGVVVVMHAEPGLRATADPHALTIAVGHLVDNAIKASPAGETVEITAAASAHAVSITVNDRGPGVPQSVRGRLGTLFLQADQSLSRNWQGAGLGLALTMRIARAHGGDLALIPRQGGGTAALIELPVSAA